MKCSITALLVVLLSATQVWAYPTGAGTCEPDLTGQNRVNILSTPTHVNVDDNPRFSPDMRLVDENGRPTKSYVGGAKYTITVTSGVTFNGFLLQARATLTNTRTGVFTANDDGWFIKDNGFPALSPDCDKGSSITHKNTLAKTSLTFQWTAPPANTGPLAIKGIIYYAKSNKIGNSFINIPPLALSEGTTLTAKAVFDGSGNTHGISGSVAFVQTADAGVPRMHVSLNIPNKNAANLRIMSRPRQFPAPNDVDPCSSLGSVYNNVGPKSGYDAGDLSRKYRGAPAGRGQLSVELQLNSAVAGSFDELMLVDQADANLLDLPRVIGLALVILDDLNKPLACENIIDTSDRASVAIARLTPNDDSRAVDGKLGGVQGSIVFRQRGTANTRMEVSLIGMSAVQGGNTDVARVGIYNQKTPIGSGGVPLSCATVYGGMPAVVDTLYLGNLHNGTTFEEEAMYGAGDLYNKLNMGTTLSSVNGKDSFTDVVIDNDSKTFNVDDILGMNVVVFDATNNVLACAPIVVLDPQAVVALQATFVTPPKAALGTGTVTGAIRFIQRGEEPAHIHVNLEGAEAVAKWHIHMNAECGDPTKPVIFNPTNSDPPPGIGGGGAYRTGDLTAKFGTFAGVGSVRRVFTDKPNAQSESLRVHALAGRYIGLYTADDTLLSCMVIHHQPVSNTQMPSVDGNVGAVKMSFNQHTLLSPVLVTFSTPLEDGVVAYLLETVPGAGECPAQGTVVGLPFNPHGAEWPRVPESTAPYALGDLTGIGGGAQSFGVMGLLSSDLVGMCVVQVNESAGTVASSQKLAVTASSPAPVYPLHAYAAFEGSASEPKGLISFTQLLATSPSVQVSLTVQGGNSIGQWSLYAGTLNDAGAAATGRCADVGVMTHDLTLLSPGTFPAGSTLSATNFKITDILGQTLILHRADGSRMSCASVRLGQLQVTYPVHAHAHFDAGDVRGYVLFRQLSATRAVEVDVAIDEGVGGVGGVNATWAVVNDNIVGDDACARYLVTESTIFDNRGLADKYGTGPYNAVCNPASSTRGDAGVCANGDLGNKLGHLHTLAMASRKLAGGYFTVGRANLYRDSYIQLAYTNNKSILGRSIVVTSPAGVTVACATIVSGMVPVVDAIAVLDPSQTTSPMDTTSIHGTVRFRQVGDAPVRITHSVTGMRDKATLYRVHEYASDGGDCVNSIGLLYDPLRAIYHPATRTPMGDMSTKFGTLSGDHGSGTEYDVEQDVMKLTDVVGLSVAIEADTGVGLNCANVQLLADDTTARTAFATIVTDRETGDGPEGIIEFSQTTIAGLVHVKADMINLNTGPKTTITGWFVANAAIPSNYTLDAAECKAAADSGVWSPLFLNADGLGRRYGDLDAVKRLRGEKVSVDDDMMAGVTVPDLIGRTVVFMNEQDDEDGNTVTVPFACSRLGAAIIDPVTGKPKSPPVPIPPVIVPDPVPSCTQTELDNATTLDTACDAERARCGQSDDPVDYTISCDAAGDSVVCVCANPDVGGAVMATTSPLSSLLAAAASTLLALLVSL